MAYEEIPEPEFAGAKGQFLKVGEVFRKVGDKFIGIFQRVSETNPTAFENADQCADFTFETDKGLACLTLRGRLRAQLEKAQLVKGNCVLIQFAALVDTKHVNKARSFRVAVDRAFKGAPPKNGANVVVPVYEPKNASGADPFGQDGNADIPF